MLFDRQVTHIGEQQVLLNLQLIRGGRSAIVSRVPKCPGVYSWYRSFACPPPATTSAELFANYLIEQATARHCLDRRASVPPVYEVVLRSHKRLSEQKQESLTKLCESPRFREDIAAVLRSAFLFQQPLYIGKAEELATRVDEHLQAGSVLQERLGEVGIQLRDCWLLCVLLPDLGLGGASPATPATSPDPNGVEESLSPELVVEDLLSRLFHPLFTQRYG
jgi:hypothetical protein